MPAGLSSVRVFAPAKLNLVLQAFERRSDGLHRLRSAVAALALGDDVIVRRRPGPLAVRYEGADIDPALDLVRAAASALAIDGDGCEVTVHKRVPLQAGLGGGSSDAAAGALALSLLTGASLPRDAARYEAIGADVPFFTRRSAGLAVIDGAGTVASFEDGMPPAWGIVLLQPTVRMPTAAAYAMLDAARANGVRRDDGGELMRAFSDAWRRRDFLAACQVMLNDFSGPLEEAHPQIAEARTRLLASGVAATILCGSGSCVAGLCPDERSAAASFSALSVGSGEWAAVTSFWRGDA